METFLPTKDGKTTCVVAVASKKASRSPMLSFWVCFSRVLGKKGPKDSVIWYGGLIVVVVEDIWKSAMMKKARGTSKNC